MSTLIAGLDVGGTFTDLVLYDSENGNLTAIKVPSVRDAPDRAVLAALDKSGIAPDRIGRVLHGTTVATNALLERRGARAALVTTEGFRDVLELGRTTRLVPNTLYDPYFRRPPPLIRRRDRHGVSERIAADGSITVPLDTDAIERLAEKFAADGVEAVAVAFLNSYANPAHEILARKILLRKIPHVSMSTDVLNEAREFERFSAVAINIYVMPVMAAYVGRLTGALRQRNPAASFYTMASHGGLLPSRTVCEQPVRTILSGPAAGITSAVHLMRRTGIANLITYDMGGTSTDVALIADWKFPLKRETILEGLVVHLAQLDIHTIGAGGGSIASLDAGGSLHVGPESAGAVPGPACYRRGGTRPTVTDANVVLGRIGADQELGGSLAADRSAAEAAIAGIAQEAGMDITTMAEAILRLAVVKMAAAVHEISVARGFDSREFALLSYGGAGPLHACEVAAEINISRVIVPPAPGAFSAFGTLCADLMKDRSVSVLKALTETSLSDAATRQAELAAALKTEFIDDGLNVEEFASDRQFDMRYAGQAHELTIACPDGARPDGACPDGASAAELTELFETAFEREYGRRDKNRGVELVTARVLGRIPIPPPNWPRPAPGSGQPAAFRRLAGDTNCPVYLRADLPHDRPVAGPAIIEEMTATFYLPPGWQVVIGEAGELIATRA